MNLIIRPLTIDDEEAWSNSFQHSFDVRFNVALKRTGWLHAFVDGQLAGDVNVRPGYDPIGNIGYEVKQRYRNMGIGFELAKAAFKVCQGWEQDIITICCFENNIPSKKIIQKLGGIIIPTDTNSPDQCLKKMCREGTVLTFQLNTKQAGQ